MIDLPPGVGGMPKAAGIAGRLRRGSKKHARHARARAFLQAMVPWAVKKFDFDAGQVRARAGRLDHRRQLSRCPIACSCTTSRSSTNTCSGRCAATPRPKGKFKLYAVEGGTAAMCYIFKSLKANRLLNPGDTIALGTPIFTPYLEMPHLEDYDLNIVNVQAQQENRFQFTDAELEKLLDPKVKAFFVVNPGNPYAVALSRRDDREDRRDPEEAPRSDPAHRRCLRHVRAGIPLAARRVPAEHHRRLLVQQVLRLHRLAAGHRSRCTKTTSSTR